MPRGWSYPTLWWEAGEVVSDTIVIPLGSATPGSYEVFVGLADMETGERVAARSTSGEAYPHDAVPLMKIGR